jgi:GPI mannosyltransferase 3
MARSAGHNIRRNVLWIALLAIALALRIAFTLNFPSIYHPDEIFQTVEPAHRLAFGYGVITWEWRLGVRSWVLPMLLAGVMRATDWAGVGGSGYRYAITVVLSIASLSNIWFASKWAKRVSGSEAAIIAAGACAIFFELVYFAPKALTEVIATDVLLPGIYYGVFSGRLGEKKRLILAGALCGLAASLRIQLMPAVAFSVIYFCYPRWRQRVPAVFAGLAIPFLLFGVVDKVTWSYPWQSFFRYFYVNAVQGRSLYYGVEPWYWYLPALLTLLGPIIFFILPGAFRSPFLATLALIIVASHSLLSHKEIRFLYPVFPLAITLASIGFVESTAGIRDHFKWPVFSRAITGAGLLFFSCSSAIVASSYRVWVEVPGAQSAFDHLSRETTLCGVGLYGVSWTRTGGYSHLHRNVPIIPISDRIQLDDRASAFNALVAPSGMVNLPASFDIDECWNGTCVYHRVGACKKPELGYGINEVLRDEGS